eukprot:945718-Pyramimonas_sp.AAC.1
MPARQKPLGERRFPSIWWPAHVCKMRCTFQFFGDWSPCSVMFSLPVLVTGSMPESGRASARAEKRWEVFCAGAGEACASARP